MQNIPADKRTRNCFQATEGNVWVSADFKSQEMMIMADKSGEEGFINVLNSKKDIHCFAGSMMYGREIDPIKDKSIRTKVKTVNFGKAYGMSPEAMAERLQISIEESKSIFALYEKSFPKLTSWLKNQGEFAKKNLFSRSFAPCERIRWFPKMKKVLDEYISENPDWSFIQKTEGEVVREGANMPIQACGADICKEALVGVRNLIKNKYEGKAKLICQVHDAIDSECKEDLAEEYAKEKSKIMIDCGNKYVSKVKMDTDVTITKEWTK